MSLSFLPRPRLPKIHGVHSIPCQTRTRSRLAGLLSFALLSVLICGCAGGTGAGPSTVISVSASCTPASINVGQTSTCNATVNGGSGVSQGVSWTVSPSSAGTISSSGVFSASVVGTATITATSTQDASKSTSVAVTVNPPPTIKAITVNCSPISLILGTGTTSQCSASVEGTGAYNTTILWSASSGTISSSGVFTPASGGSVIVTASSAQDPTKTAQFTLAVFVPPITSSFKIDGPGGGSITAVAPDPSEPGTLYAAALRSGLFESTNDGSSWSRLLPTDNTDVQNVESLAISPDGTIYLTCVYCVSNSSASNSYGYGLYQSIDHGSTYTDVGLGISTGVLSVTVDPLNSDVIYASDTKGGVYRSSDSGSTWTTIVPDDPTCPATLCETDVIPDLGTDGVLYLPGMAGLSVSRDYGTTWALIGGSPAGPCPIFVQSPSDPSLLYEDCNSEFYSSSNDGVTWTDTGTQMDGQSAVINPTNPDDIYASADVFFDISTFSYVRNVLIHSTDGGTSWSLTNYGAMPSMQWLPNTSTLLGLAPPHLWRLSLADPPWIESDQGLSANFGFQVVVDPNSPRTLYLAASNGAGISKSTDGGSTWQNTLTCDALAVAVDPFDSTHVLASVAAGMDNCPSTPLQVSTNGGSTWSNGATSTGIQGYIHTIVFDPKTRGTIYLTSEGGGISKSTDGGATWTTITSGLSSKEVFCMAIDPTNAQTLLAGTAGGLYRSSDGGQSWSEVDPAQVTSLAFDGTYSGVVYASGNVLLKSIDHGRSWTDITPSLSGNPNLNVVVDPGVPDSLFLVVSLDTVGWSVDGGQTWDWFKNILPQTNLTVTGDFASTIGGVSLSGSSETTPEVLYFPSMTSGVISLSMP